MVMEAQLEVHREVMEVQLEVMNHQDMEDGKDIAPEDHPEADMVDGKQSFIESPAFSTYKQKL